jgi:MFS family permease
LSLLSMGDSGVGYLTSALGVGALFGSALAIALVGKGGRLTAYFGVGILLLGFPLTLVGIWPSTTAALVFLALTGVGDTLVEVTMRTLLQTTVPDDILGRVFGVLGSMLLGAIALGAVAVPLLIAMVGVRGAFIATGLLLPALLIVFGRRLLAIETHSPARANERDLLLGVPIFAPLPAAVVAALATKLNPLVVDPGELVFSQGDGGDVVYLIDDGSVEISVDGEPVRALGPGDYFGEIALLRDVPRTASATAVASTTLLTLDRDSFLAAVTGDPASTRAADAAVSARLATAKPIGVSI